MTTPPSPGPHDAAELLGRWRLMRANAVLDFAPGAQMEFQPGGRLLYSFDVGARREIVTLVYRVEGDLLHTDNPLTTHEMATRFEIGAGGVLIFDFAGAHAWFVREL